VTALLVTEGQSAAAGDALFTLGFGQSLEEGGTLDTALRRSLDAQDAVLRDRIASETARSETEGARLAAQVAGPGAKRAAIEVQPTLQDRRAAVAKGLARTAADLRAQPACRDGFPPARGCGPAGPAGGGGARPAACSARRRP
jgi:hypothetical protein